MTPVLPFDHESCTLSYAIGTLEQGGKALHGQRAMARNTVESE